MRSDFGKREKVGTRMAEFALVFCRCFLVRASKSSSVLRRLRFLCVLLPKSSSFFFFFLLSSSVGDFVSKPPGEERGFDILIRAENDVSTTDMFYSSSSSSSSYIYVCIYIYIHT